ncbi:hypothetical protein A7G13_13120 [Listeria monocytogenes]|nr:hypothetical protein [Listeria monocytogenes]
MCIWDVIRFALNGRMGMWGFRLRVDGFYLEGKLLCGGRTLLGGLHARFVCMDIWAVIRFALNGRMGMWVFG